MGGCRDGQVQGPGGRFLVLTSSLKALKSEQSRSHSAVVAPMSA